MKVTIKRTKPTKENIKNIYDTLNKIFDNPNLFYTDTEFKKVKEDKKNKIL